MVAVLAAVTFLLLPPVLSDARVPESIDLNAGTEPANCAPCHLRLAESRSPGMIFSHGMHLIVSCDTCHIRPAHEAGAKNSPPMETCFACHGLQHGPVGEIAASQCEACHTPAFNLRPRSHVPDWPLEPHAERARRDTNQCMMCHDAPLDCDTCHQAEGLDIGQMPGTYLSVIVTPLAQPVVTVYPTEPTSMGQCIYCHPDIDDFLPGRIIFAHADHLRRNYQCSVCHPRFGHGIEGVRRSDMLSCYRCHGTTHGSTGLLATEDCLACHPAEFELKPPDHTPAFESSEHKERADSEPEYCAMCHQPDFCVECHMGRRPDGPGSEKVIPADHRLAEWISGHGEPFLQGRGACGSCHDSPSCKLCHQTVMPHPSEWLADHAPDPGVDRQDCNVCHTDRNSCQVCHHESVRYAELTRENCVECHDEMKQEPATGIKHKGFAEHAVHFDVAEIKGKPYRCYDCHVSFGSNGNGSDGRLRELEKLQAHDLRLCYECHGALDFRSALIAPYKGAALCKRCHYDIGL
ncbi:MAG: cytochrome c3 family protein [Coriobacteriia bacterium]|nr:cytochrome c3 family protein [Coriobacteriia bacterium]